jgi:hypothetical protein
MHEREVHGDEFLTRRGKRCRALGGRVHQFEQLALARALLITPPLVTGWVGIGGGHELTGS